MSVPAESAIVAYANQRRASLGKSVDAELHAGTLRAFTGDPHPYVTRGLENVCSDLAGMGDGQGRNTYLNDQLWRFVGYAAAGHIDEATVLADLRDAARASGLGDLEVRKVFRGDSTGAITNGRATPLDPPPMTAEQLERYRGGRTTHSGDLAWTPPDLPAGIDPATGEVLAGATAGAGEPGEDDLEVRRYAAALARELHLQRVRRDARQYLDDEQHAASFRVPEQFGETLADELLIPDEPVRYAVEGLVPAGGNVLLAAQFKAGKTTLVTNLARTFADGGEFLGRFAVNAPTEGRFALWNYEVDAAQYRRWMRESRIAAPERIVALHLRGYSVPITVPRVAQWCVEWLKRHEVRWWCLDPFARAFTGKSENDNTEVARWLDALDEVKHRAGVEMLVLPAHTGREVHEVGRERVRGATRLDDWADVRWLLTRDEAGSRFLRATGRDVEVAEEQLTHDEATRSLLFGGHDRAGVAKRRLEDIVVAVVGEHPGITTRDLYAELRKAGLKGRVESLNAPIASAARYRRISVEQRGQATLHFPIGKSSLVFTPPADVVAGTSSPTTGSSAEQAVEPPRDELGGGLS